MARITTVNCDRCGTDTTEADWGLQFNTMRRPDPDTGYSAMDFISWDLCDACAREARAQLVALIGQPGDRSRGVVDDE